MLAPGLLARRNVLNLPAFNSWRTLLRTARHRPSSTAAHKIQPSVLEQQQPQRPFTRAYPASKVMEIPEGVFRGLTDRFAGVTVDGREENVDKSSFRDKLQKSLDFWTTNKNRAIWFRVYKEQADWVPILAENGFDFHHARTGVVVMYRWLPEQESNNLPTYAHTLVGVGGLVINDQDEVLVVSERYAMIPNSWKLPGGYVEPRENLIDAAMREVAEETGIRTEFRSVVTLRHAHGGTFGCSDLYVVVALKPLNLDFKRCEREIARLQWMPIAEYLQHPHVHETNRQFVCTFLDYQKRGLSITCRDDVHQVLKKKYNLYYVEREQKEQQQDQNNS
ncbi:nudix hydrolase 8 [Drosophila elegans]|uniref:nudix hydrolase 8 n=1 Tax=Drosophila elegans TaxID=30023 RepID=UPI0007E80B4D|nr:nudix hydrolase 8 [Drosophila elegans]XP_017113460.1 nudix hydrolase 8 [Drosophila elegans]